MGLHHGGAAPDLLPLRPVAVVRLQWHRNRASRHGEIRHQDNIDHQKSKTKVRDSRGLRPDPRRQLKPFQNCSVWDTRRADADRDLVSALEVPRLFQDPQKGLRVREDRSVIHGSAPEAAGFALAKGGFLIAVTSLRGQTVEFYKSDMDVPTLSELCRDAVRSAAVDLPDGVHGLPLPRRLKAFLLYSDFNWVGKESQAESF